VLAASPDRPLLRQLQASCRTAANRRCVPEPDSCGAEEPIALFDDLVGAAKQRDGDHKPERLGGLEVES
jgi:hypothetical protein